MTRSNLRTYAPKARRDFIRAMSDRAAIYGLTENKIEPVTEKGDVAIIAGKAYPASVAAKRKLLDERIKRQGFHPVMETCAYTWFNRFAAIRFMEIHAYLDHGYRVLSHPEGKAVPEIVEHAEHVDLPGLDKSKVIDLKLDGTKEGELYRMLLVAQCNALHSAMPFLFERINDETELLLPDNLLHSDSLIRQLVNEIDEADWQEIEIIGWLYESYISERYEAVIGNVVASEDIPAATQRFTPNWIVKYLVQNTLGRLWMATYPHSPLRQQMEYYIEPAKQTPDVQAQLKAITPTELNPEELTLMDPASGSGHILVEGYDIFKAIYQERGYRAKDIPRLILQKNLFGLEIDDRAAQLAAFALMMKARADDRRIFDSDAKPNILAFQDSKGMNAADITHALNSPINKEEIPSSEYLFEEIELERTPLFSENSLTEKGHVSQGDIASLLALFESAKTFGSLIQVPSKLAAILPEIEHRLKDVLKHGDLTHRPAYVIKPLLQQTRLLARQYDAVVANPPYMGNKYYDVHLKSFVETSFPDAKGDLYACFIARLLGSLKPNGRMAMITIPTWMFLAGFTSFRKWLLKSHAIESFIHNGRGVFGADFGSCSFTIWNPLVDGFVGCYRRLFDRQGSVPSLDDLKQRFFTARTYIVHQEEFLRIASAPIAYWLNEKALAVFCNPPLATFATSAGRCKTHNDHKYVRFRWEVASPQVGDGKRWKCYEKGGPYRKYYGNRHYIFDWSEEARAFYASHGGLSNSAVWGKLGVTWTDVTSSLNGFRLKVSDAENASASPTILFDGSVSLSTLLGYLNSSVTQFYLRVLNPTIHVNVGDVLSLPVPPLADCDAARLQHNTEHLIQIATKDWDSQEESFDFIRNPMIEGTLHDGLLVNQFELWRRTCDERRAEFRRYEEDNNRIVIAACGLHGDVEATIADEQITLYRPDCEEDVKRLISYAVGCMVGRYSLDTPGLIYAYNGNMGFDLAQYKTFRADDDGIIPLTDTAWFNDDTTNRVIEFISVALPKEHLEENLQFISESLGRNKDEQPRDTIRRYLGADFFKHHLTMYKRRPIYWLFSSGRQRAFQSLVYLHRYNEGTLSRMRTEYVIPLQGKISARIEQLAGDIAAATSTAFRSKLTKERDKLVKQQAELQAFDEKLRHYAELRISLDLDEGVKVNYGKFGDLLAEAKAVTGGKEEE